ncbi:UNVERIFIED_CONTAM: hypothetical protein GTU68_024742, partial [Idotea baltica]|nr:hypothetical protein [Idotea baltica]
FFLYIPLAFVGVPAKVIGIVAPLHLFAQFWYHTRLIKRMGFLEHIIVTPSHHRVHHAINDEYLDKNFGQIFIVWDKWFGTFQEELDDVPAVYGVKKAVNTWNPILINYQHMWLLIRDAWFTQNYWDKIRIWFMPTGWRPTDVSEIYPLEIIEDPYAHHKYETTASTSMKTWMLFQLVLHNVLMLYMFNQIGNFEFIDILLYGLFLTISIFSYTSLMDGNRINLIAETLKLALGISLLVQLNGWFGIDQFIVVGSYAFAAYLILSMLAAIYFSFIDRAEVVEIART